MDSFTSGRLELRNDEIHPTRSHRSRSTSRSSNKRSRSSTTGSFINFLSDRRKHDTKVFSIYKLLMLELNLPNPNKSSSPPNDINQESFDQIFSLVKIPIVLEKFMALGLLICLNSFLTLFTLVPIRIIVISFMTIKSYLKKPDFDLKKWLFARRDSLTVALIITSLIILSLPTLDISKMYHDVRGQAQIKLYVMFGVLEVADKLCSSIGQDILTITYDLVSCKFNQPNIIKFLIFFILSIIYLSLHGFVLIYQTVSLNVAANSYSNALLTLLFSNQFSELRSSVFKKFEREGLFQLTMADLTERYQLSLMLSMIALRNMLQLNSINESLIPNSWQSWNKWFGALFGPSIVVLGSEIIVDWLKHCYITKFNKIRPRIYKKFIYVLALDYLEVFKATSLNSNLEYELSDYLTLTKRIGLPLLATTVCFLRMSLNDIITVFTVSSTSRLFSFIGSFVLLIISFVILLLSRLILGLLLLRLTSSIKQKHEMAHEISIIDETEEKKVDDSIIETPSKTFIETPSKSREPVSAPPSPRSPLSPRSPVDISFLPGIPSTEMSNIEPIRSRLYDKDENVPPNSVEKRNKDFSEKYKPSTDEGLNNVSRYEMSSKRIW